MSRKRIPAEVAARIVDEWKKQTKTQRQLAAEFGFSRSMIQYVLRRVNMGYSFLEENHNQPEPKARFKHLHLPRRCSRCGGKCIQWPCVYCTVRSELTCFQR